VCPRWLQRALLGEWVARRWAGPLTLTPCDLWRFLGPLGRSRGRTLWLIGDSQVRRVVLSGSKGLQCRVVQQGGVVTATVTFLRWLW
jgi:hypothetical protein